MTFVRKRLDRLMERRTASIPSAILSADERLGLVSQFGDFSLAYSTAVQKDLFYFGDARGYIAFARKMSSAYVLGDPIAAPADRGRLIRDFVRDGKDPMFVQVGEASARALADLGYTVARLGIDSRIPLDARLFSGKRNETVRYSERWLLNNGYALAEDLGADDHSARLAQLSAHWRAGRIVRRREMGFLNRQFRLKIKRDMRRFLLTGPDGSITALLDFDPICSDGEVIGYTTVFKRKLPGATPHAEIGLTKFAAGRFRDEGKRLLTLGLSPLAEAGPSGFRDSAVFRSSAQWLYGSDWINRRVFNLQGQAAFKRRFHGIEEPTYIAFRRLSLMQMVGLLRLCKAL